MKKSSLIVSIIVILLMLTSCEFQFAPVTPPGFTITWQNADGTILEVDSNVSKGIVPTYDGPIPTKEAVLNITYKFTGWTPSVTSASENTTYTATFREVVDGQDVLGIEPLISTDTTSILYGLYPQTKVNDQEIIAKLNNSTIQTNGWVLYNNEYYVSHQAKVYNNENYTFSDGTKIISGQNYWFKCEPISWQVLKNDQGTYTLLTSKLLDAFTYYPDYQERIIEEVTIKANNYQFSDVRTFLEENFYTTAFAFNNSYVQIQTIDHYINHTYLLSYDDYLNPSYGFDNNPGNKSTTRTCQLTDYAKANGAWSNLDNYGSYWTRSASNEYYYCAWNVNSGGYLSEYTVDGTGHALRPAITIYIP